MADTTNLRVTGISGTSQNSFFNMLKVDYLPKVDDWYHTSSGVIGPMIAKKKGQMGGQKSVFAVFTNHTGGVGFRGENFHFPEPVPSSAVQPEVLSRRADMRVRWTLETIKAARKGSAAFAQPKSEELRMARESFKTELERAHYQGPFHNLGVVASHADGVLTMASRNDRRYTAASYFKSGTHLMRVGHRVQLIDASASGTIGGAALGAHGSAGSTENTALYIGAINDSDPTAPTASLYSAATGAAITDPSATASFGAAPQVGDYIIPFASRLDAVATTFPHGTPSSAANAISALLSMNGLGNIATDTTIYSALFGLDKSASNGLLATVNHNSGTPRTYSDRLLEGLVTSVRTKTGGAGVTLLLDDWTYLGVTNEYRNLRQFGSVIGDAGVKNPGLVLNDATRKYKTDWNCPPGAIWCLDTNAFGYLEQMPLSAPDDVESRWVANKAAEEVVAVKMGNIVCTSPWVQACLEDISFDVTGATL